MSKQWITSLSLDDVKALIRNKLREPKQYGKKEGYLSIDILELFEGLADDPFFFNDLYSYKLKGKEVSREQIDKKHKLLTALNSLESDGIISKEWWPLYEMYLFKLNLKACMKWLRGEILSMEGQLESLPSQISELDDEWDQLYELEKEVTND